MSDKVMEIEFEDDITIEEVLEELLYYQKIGQTVVCEFQGKKLNNKDIDKLK